MPLIRIRTRMESKASKDFPGGGRDDQPVNDSRRTQPAQQLLNSSQ
jgi:hypothetical protein